MTLYRNIALELRAQIEQGVYRYGERMPSVRQLSSRLGVSVSTAVSAYQCLERDGLVESRHKSGFYVSPPLTRSPSIPGPGQSIKPTRLHMSATLARIFALTRSRDCVHLDLALPDPKLQPASQLKASANRILRNQFDGTLKLCSSPGEPQLRRQIALHMSRLGCLIEPDDVVITNGCQEAVLITLQSLTQPGDVIAVESPCYYGFLQASESLGLKVVRIESHVDRGADVGALTAATQRWPIKAFLCAPSFSNPSGSLMPVDARRQMLALARQADFTIIEDDIFGELWHRECDRPVPLRAEDTDNRVIYCSSFSKSLSPGLRLGWVVAGTQRERLMERQRATTTGTAALPQLQLTDYLQSGHFDKHLIRVRQEYAQNLERARHLIAREFPEGTQVSQPLGGYLLWLSLPENLSAMELLERALAKGIAFMPGAVFGGAQYGHNLRLSLARPWCLELERALILLGKLVDELLGQSI
ncbi:PLP-dependent aminotransferase family protein [Pseudomaricurvus alkylphenolicus]|uniref:aminotransferase-like domain-containing protein n=1 Tax=Pseudomaricurvus alkylphenolicus TaxID=1306991 RepID=UPI001423BBE5|nr:PLP-dependent aminotransferase family protein [Pseudomaricurvus alkylphenolicus]NIB39572.1 PLP-dependent aminotransferase family protein [Pseudomaricurvus alkylphenolicus]